MQLKIKQENIKIYDYYKSLGYSEEASVLMTLLVYGDVSTQNLFSKASNFQELYSHISESTFDSIDTLLKQYMPMPNDVITAAPLQKTGIFKSLLNKTKTTKNMSSLQGAQVSAERNAYMSITKAAPLPAMPMMENIAYDSYEPITEKDAKNSFTSPSSTFQMTTNTASMGILLNQIRNNRPLSMSQIRIEEVLNYFNYSTNKAPHDKIKIETAVYKKDDNKALVYINTDMGGEAKKNQNIVLLLDVSGSMYSNTSYTQQAIATIISKLNQGDILSLITYSSKDTTVLNGYKIKSDQDKETLMYKIMKDVLISGCTYGSAGIETAYKIGKKHYNKKKNNEVILITDGDLNFGITKKDGLKSLIEEKKQSGLFLSVIGTGLWNFQDDKLETLAKHGNGIYVVINGLKDVDYSINQRFLSLTQVVAKDVKAQVEFNPKIVKTYRLLGYENRELNHEDFENDEVVSEPYGLGGHGVALYEIEFQSEEAKSPLKYQQPELTNSDELGELRIRYKEPLEDVSKEVVKPIFVTDKNDFDVMLAYALYVKSELLRGSKKIDEKDKEFLENFDASLYEELNKDNLELFLKASEKHVALHWL